MSDPNYEKQPGPQYQQQGIPVSPEYVNPVQAVNLQPVPQAQPQYVNGYPQPQAFVAQNNQVPISTIPVQNGQPQYVQGQYVNVQPGVQMPVQPVPVATMAPPRFDDLPLIVECPYCHYTGPTRVEHEIGPILILFTIVFFCAVACFAFILLCIPQFQRPVHKCSRCGATLGIGDECHNMYSEDCC